MSVASIERRGRLIHLRCIREDDSLDPTGQARYARGDAPPRLDRDYRAISPSELVSLDLRRARIVLEPSYYCDLRCRFCDLPVHDRTSLDPSRWRSILQLLRIGGAKHLTLTGGEPAIHPNIRSIVRDVATWGFHVGMLSHGVWAANRGYLDTLLDAGLREIDVSLKATDREVFHLLTGKDRVTRQRAGLAAISKARADGRLSSFRVNHVLTASTLPSLGELAWLGELPSPPLVTITLVEPYRPDMIDEVPIGEVLLQQLADGLAALEGAGLAVRTEGIPWCYLGPRAGHSRDAQRYNDRAPRITISPRSDGDYLLVHFGYQRYLQFTRTSACEGCAHGDPCPGVHKKVVELVPPRPGAMK